MHGHSLRHGDPRNVREADSNPNEARQAKHGRHTVRIVAVRPYSDSSARGVTSEMSHLTMQLRRRASLRLTQLLAPLLISIVTKSGLICEAAFLPDAQKTNASMDSLGEETSHINTLWPESPPKDTPETPLAYDQWSGPYRNDAGRRWVETINSWFRDGTAAGLWQDTFRSFDNDHSSIHVAAYPQLRRMEPVDTFGPSFANIIPRGVTFGVQSFGVDGLSVIDARSRSAVRRYYEGGTEITQLQSLHTILYARNFCLVAPAVGSFGSGGDRFTFLSPCYLHSTGRSGSDAILLKPIVFAAAALPPKVKTRVLRKGLYVPTLMYLFKSAIAGGIKSPEAHLPAYTLPTEADDNYAGLTPFIDGLINSAHELKHIPPVCRIAMEPVYVRVTGTHSYGGKAYGEKTPFGFVGALREGQEFHLEVDLRDSWVDEGFSLSEYYTAVLRGPGTIEKQNGEGSRLRIRVPWTVMDKDKDFRTDILLLVSDGTYFSAPAYISVRHIHKLDPLVLGLRP